MPHIRQFVATLLALAYSVIAIAGYGLHELVPCGDGNCFHEQVVTCCCGHDHGSPPAGDSDRQALRGPQHDPQACAFCALLAKMKMGHADPQAAQLLVQVDEPVLVLTPSAALADELLLHAPRGPPSLAA